MVRSYWAEVVLGLALFVFVVLAALASQFEYFKRAPTMEGLVKLYQD